MKKVLILIITLLFISHTAICKETLIWDYNKDEFLKDLLEGKPGSIGIVDHKKLDQELSKSLEVELIYTNLKECLEIALDNNYNIKIKDSIKAENKWEFKNAKAQFLPDFSYIYNIQDLSGTYLVGGILTRTVHEVPITSTFQVLWSANQGKKFFTFAQRKNKLNSSCSNLNYTRDEIIRDTALLYYELLGLKLNLEVLKSNLIDRHEQYNLTAARYKIGEGAKFDVVRAVAEEAKAKQQYITAFNNLRLKQARLANVMGIEVLNAIYPTENIIETRELVDKTYDINKLYSLALDDRDDIKAQKWNIQALKSERNSKYADFAPDIQLLYQESRQGTVRLGIFPSTTYGVFLTVPLGDKLGVGSYTKIKSYNAKIDQEQLKLTELTRTIKENILNSYYNSKTALEKVEAAKKEVASTDESLKIALVRMAVGQSTFLDVIAAQSLKVDARQRLIATMIEYNRAQVQLLFDAGIISVNNVLVNYKMPTQTP